VLEDIRNHSAIPSAQENEWMEARPFGALVRVAFLCLIAAVIVAVLPAVETPSPVVAVAAAR
jgi:hypothetical protein